jgi:hypothetical protein
VHRNSSKRASDNRLHAGAILREFHVEEALAINALEPVSELPVTDEIHEKGEGIRHMLIQALVETFAQGFGEIC